MTLFIDFINRRRVRFACFFVGTYIVCGASQNENHKTGELQYEVTIDDTVSMTEFNKKYEIIEQRGDIFVVKEKRAR